MNKSLTNFVYLMVILASTFIIILGLQSSAYIINSILMAAMITIAVLPLPLKMVRRGTRPSLAMFLTLLLVVVGLGLIVGLAFVSIGSVSSEFSLGDTSQVAADSAEESKTQLEQYPSSIQNLIEPSQANQVIAAAVSFIGQFISQTIIVILIFIFMLSAAVTTPISDQFEQATSIPTAERISSFTKDVQQYISTTTMVNLLVGIGDAILLFILGVPFAALWGILAWLMGYIPTVGFWIALIPPFVLAWVTLGFPTAAIVFVGYVVINGSAENLVKPRVMGQSLNISPLVIFVSVFFWGWVLGGIGAILAVPLTLMILSILDGFEATRWLAVLARPATPDREKEREEAHSRLKDLRQKASRAVKGNDDQVTSRR
jgi:predicted PurR-regulated permease PerM